MMTNTNGNPKIRSGLTRSIIRSAFILVAFGSIVLVLVQNVFPNQYDGIIALLAVLTTFVLASPVDQYIEDAFANNLLAADEFRNNLKQNWIDGYLAQERRLLGENGEGEPLPVHFQIENTPPLPSISFIPEHDTLISIFDKLTQGVIERNKKLRKDEYPFIGEYIILQAEQGGRKTVQLLKLAEHLLNNSRLPLYVNLFSWAAGCNDFEEWLKQELTRNYNMTPRNARQLLETNYFVLLLDGFDEVPHNLRLHCLEAIKRFLKRRNPWHNTTISNGQKNTVFLCDAVVISVSRTKSENSSSSIPNELKTQVDTMIEEFQAFQKPYIGVVLNVAIARTDEDELTPYLRHRLRTILDKKFESLQPRTYWSFSNQQRVEIVGKMISEIKGKGLIDIFCKSPFYLQAFLETIELKTHDPSMINHHFLTKWIKLHSHKLKLNNISDSTNLDVVYQLDSPILAQAQVTEKNIITSFVETKLRQQPGDIGPTASGIGDKERRHVLTDMARDMKARNQQYVGGDDVNFYLENIGINWLFPRSATDHPPEEKKREQDRFRSIVTVITTMLFFLAGIAYFIMLQFGPLSELKTSTQITSRANLIVLNHVSNEEMFQPAIVIAICIILFVFGRIFGWSSCGDLQSSELQNRYAPEEVAMRRDRSIRDTNRITYPLVWNLTSGLQAGLCMGAIVSLLFAEISRLIYIDIVQPPLIYESLVAGLFSFGLFTLLGGLVLGRRFEVVAHPYEGRQFLLWVSLVSFAVWAIFFTLFLFWPRVRLETLSPELLGVLPGRIFAFALYTGAFIGIMTGLVMSHLYIRHLSLLVYLSQERNLRSQYKIVLENGCQLGLLRRVGGGYLFRHHLIMEYFADS